MTKPKPSRTFKQKGDRAEASAFTDERVRNEKDLIRVCKIDVGEWAVDHWICEVYEAQRADRHVNLTYVDGMANGTVKDQGRTTVTQMYLVKAWLKRRVAEIRTRSAVADFIADAKRHAPKYPRIKRPSLKSGMMFEIDIPDLHFGKETWSEESGADYDMSIAREIVHAALDQLLGFARMYPIQRVLFPLGNDYFNVDNSANTTAHGTPQQEDSRWNKTFRLGRILATEMIDRCLALAPVDVMIVPGNHDEQRMFYLGEALTCQYARAKDVQIDNRAAKRKYYRYSDNLIGFTHGYYERLEKLPALMPTEVPDLWARTKFREWHLGDKHHKKDLLFQTEDKGAVTIRLLRSLSSTDTWHFDKAFTGNIRAAEAFLWHPRNGLVAQFNAVAT